MYKTTPEYINVNHHALCITYVDFQCILSVFRECRPFSPSSPGHFLHQSPAPTLDRLRETFCGCRHISTSPAHHIARCRACRGLQCHRKVATATPSSLPLMALHLACETVRRACLKRPLIHIPAVSTTSIKFDHPAQLSRLSNNAMIPKHFSLHNLHSHSHST
jgi:hypothetical protein